MPQNQQPSVGQQFADQVEDALTYKNLRDKVSRAANWLTGSKPAPQPAPAPPPDTSWHDDMVRRANQSFADAAKAQQQPKPASQPAGKRMMRRTK